MDYYLTRDQCGVLVAHPVHDRVPAPSKSGSRWTCTDGEVVITGEDKVPFNLFRYVAWELDHPVLVKNFDAQYWRQEYQNMESDYYNAEINKIQPATTASTTVFNTGSLGVLSGFTDSQWSTLCESC